MEIQSEHKYQGPAWYTYPKNEAFIYQQASYHQLHHPHPSQQLQKYLCDITHLLYLHINPHLSNVTKI